MNPLTRAHLRTWVLASLALVACACGGGGGGGAVVIPGSPQPDITITTTSLPPGTTGSVYPSTQLQVVGAEGATTWTLDSGTLPPGLGLATGGLLSGTPTSNGSYAFVVRVDDGVASDTQGLLISVDVLGLAVTGGLVIDKAWTQKAVTLTTSGQAGSVSFSVISTESGGSFTTQNPATGIAVWTPGSTGGAGIVDTLRATDTGSGASIDVDFDVMPNPTDGHVAAFGTTDVWYIDPTPKDGSHAYATDFHKALADTGLRDPASTSATGTTADQLAALWVRVEILRQLNPMFLRNGDGTSAGQGLAITFPFDAPGAGYVKPSPGNSLQGSPTRYSVIALIKGSSSGVIGTAFLDGANNGYHENDTTDGVLELGVFTNQITPVFNSGYGNTLTNIPVGPADVPVLEALLYGQPNPGGRYTLISYVGRGLARTMAAVIAHEAGHSLGLDHTSPPQSGSIMNPSASISPTANYSFTSEDVAFLQTALPGAGKSTGSQTLKTGAPAPGGVRVCNCRAHGHAGD